MVRAALNTGWRALDAERGSNPWASVALLGAGVLLNDWRLDVGDEALGFAKRAKQQSLVQPQSGSREMILEKMATFEQARNKALSIVGNLGPNSKLHIGRVGDGKGKVTGRKSADGLLRWRLDWDEKKGCHINVEDFRNGKQEDASS